MYQYNNKGKKCVVPLLTQPQRFLSWLQTPHGAHKTSSSTWHQNLKSYCFLMPWLIYRTEEPLSLIQVILTLDTASLWADHPLQRQHWETSGRHRNSIATFWHAQPWVRVWGCGESIRRNTLPQEVGMASILNERKLRQGARITFLKRRVRAWRGDWMASLNNAVPFNTDLEYSGPQILQSASTLFLILTHNWFSPWFSFKLLHFDYTSSHEVRHRIFYWRNYVSD